ncbi:DUF6081 family protein [Streptomyces sp. NBC_01803]|uniref:DUF6081 family protein n=1 Tax=Streptomyces sp. NBC_01803 TaxID=2975946 RepID=UPI002DD7E30D|nr:DUF6081 family protein [Streptomyces sp. NBC_01803]WSA43105.1 DUF6081 family protein [Streptomyces sp. NBC_01803]
MSIGMKRSQLALGAAALGLVATALAPAAATAGSAAPGAKEETSGLKQVLFRDDYDNGFLTGQGGNWLVTGDEQWPAGDAVPTTSGGVLNVAPAGTNPATGDPAFARTYEQQADGSSLDHMKWLAFPQRFTSTGQLGFDIPDTGSISCEHRLSGETFGTENHPFGDAVTDPESDLRLASVGMVSGDVQSNAIADFWVTNSTIYAMYERLPSPGATYASYTYAVPVADRTPGRAHDLEIRYDQGGRRVTWFVDGRQKLQTDRIGTRAFDRRFLMLDHGGAEERLTLNQVTCGLALATILDGALPGSRGGDGLVRLENTPDFYFDPRRGAPTPQAFEDPASLPESRLWGQGAEMNVAWTQVVLRR